MAKLKQADAEALIERALAADIITKGGGGWLSFGEVKLGQGAAKAASHLVDNDEVAVSIAAAIAAKEQGGSSAGNGAGASGGASSSTAGATVTVDHGASHSKPSKPAEAGATHIVVKAKAERGRWRASRKFTREEASIPLADLTQAEIDAIVGDRELLVHFEAKEE